MPRRREIETLLLAAFAAAPLYATGAVGIVPLLLFHAVMLGMVARVASGRTPELIPRSVMRALGIAYVVFYFIDAIGISRSAIAASTHLVLFIAAYQPMESVRSNNYAQRLLAAALLFIASIATSTHITIILFVIAFAFLMLRQMMYVSHLDTIRAIGRDYAEPPSGRAAAFYLCGTAVIAAILFPFIPRVRNPVLQGVTGGLTNATTGLSDTINFNEERATPNDPSVVARVSMAQDTIPFFTPLRLRAAVYDRYWRGEWRQSQGRYGSVPMSRGLYQIARPVGFTRSASVQQRLVHNNRLLLPEGTFGIRGLNGVLEGPHRDAYYVYQGSRQMLTFDVMMARAIDPIGRRAQQQPPLTGYPENPAITAMARSIVGNETDPYKQAVAIERYLDRNFRYLARAQEIGHTMTVDEFLLRERRGHCEYFAAGEVALLGALGVPARIVGGYYGGTLNPLTGYFVVRREDAHAWVEAWVRGRWTTFDPTPATMRPGNTKAGLVSAYLAAVGDSITYFWDRYVLTYGLGDQIAFLSDLIGRVRAFASGTRDAIASGTRLAASPAFAFGVAALAGILAGAIALLRRRQSLFHLLAADLAKRGIEVGPAMTMEEALARLRVAQPEVAGELEPLIAMYEAERFSPERDRGRAAAIRRRLAELR
jgi:transglutaminase-like putative cysteine protease